jgi:integrase
MPLRLVAPGKRKGNKFWLVRGSIDGRDYEVSTKARDKAAAERFKKELERELIARRRPRPGEAMTFATAAGLYAEFRGIDLALQRERDAQRIQRLNVVLGKKMISDIRQADLVDAANILCPNLAPQTKNREVMRIGAAVLHYAAENDYCEWRRFRLFKEPQPQTRAVSIELASDLVSAAPEGTRRLLLLWLFHHGTRISQTLSITWETGISLRERVFRLYDKKGNRWREFPLHPELLEELSAIPEESRAGRLWPWRSRFSVYKWLRPLVQDMEISFTPHMARHSRGRWLNETGAGLRTIMEALGHDDPKSSIRYQSADVEMVRAASEKLGDFLGKAPAAHRKPGL